MSTLWVVVALCAAAAVVALVAAWRRASDLHRNLGTVSHQWLAEHRLGAGPYWRR